MQKEFEQYKTMQLQGIKPLDLYLVAIRDGLNYSACIRMLRAIYALSLEEAKIISFQGDTGVEYDSVKEKQAEELLKILDEELGVD